MNAPRRVGPSNLKPLDASKVVHWAEPIYVMVQRMKGAVSEAITLPSGSLANPPEPGMGYTRTEVLALPAQLLTSYGPGIYMFQIVDANNVTDSWANQVGATPQQAPQAPPPAIPLGAGSFWAQQAAASAPPAQPLWPWPMVQAPVQAAPQAAPLNFTEVLITRLLNDKDQRKEEKPDQQMGLMMMMMQQQGQAFDQRMAQFGQMVTSALQQTQTAQPRGLDINVLLEKLPVLLPFILPFLKRDDSSKDALAKMQQQLEQERDRERARREHQTQIDALERQIQVLTQATQNGKSEFLPLLQLLESRHASEQQLMAERQKAVEAKVPGLPEMLAMMQALRPPESPVVEGMQKLFEMALGMNGSGERSFGEVLVEGVRDIAGKALEAKTAAMTAQAMIQGAGPSVSQQQTLSGAPQESSPQAQVQQPQQHPPAIQQLLAAIQQLQSGAAEWAKTQGVSGMSPEEAALHIDQIAQELDKANAQIPLLQVYKQGCQKAEEGKQPNEFWTVLGQILTAAPQDYKDEVFQALIDLRGGDESEQGEQAESESAG
jgi:hypothetical protein